MFSIFKKRPDVPPASPTFKSRVESFWSWYSQVAQRFYQTIEGGQCASLAPEVAAKVDELLPGFAWVFGPGASGGHSFTISGEGVLHRQLLALYCVGRAPQINGWTFHASRQPGSIEGISIDMGGRKFDPLEFWITPAINQESKKLDITVWHPQLINQDERERMGPLFLFLDEVLGEFGTGQWIGEIHFSDHKLADAIPMKELLSFVRKVESDNGWKKPPPGQEATLYRLPNPDNRFLRDDVIVGSTVNPRLINEYLRASGAPPDPLAGTGADYVFVSFDMRILPRGQQSETRGVIEDALTLALRNAHSGRVLGGAFGIQNAYIDLLIFDDANSFAIVENVLRQLNLPAGTAINFFAKEKQSGRMVL
jgi:hypothetical protein